MPVISMFYGIIIRMFFDDHNPPHFHAEYQGKKAVFDLEGNVLQSGDFPKSKIKYVQTWAEIHHEELIANWEISKTEGEIYKIDPLK